MITPRGITSLWVTCALVLCACAVAAEAPSTNQTVPQQSPVASTPTPLVTQAQAVTLPTVTQEPTATTQPTPVQPTATARSLPQQPALFSTFSGARAMQIVREQVDYGPRIPGTAGHQRAGDAILATLAQHGWITHTQSFTYQGTLIRNIWGVKGEGEQLVILGAHYDTRRVADRDAAQPDAPVPGANDGASGVAVLLELARVLDITKTNRQVWLAFFDAEDQGELDGWDWIVGSQYFAETLTLVPSAVVIVDMVGDADQQLFYERNSDAQLMEELWGIAHQTGYGGSFIRQFKWSILDDHTPFLARGWRAIDIIDFDYPYWHTVDDTPDKISPISLERVGRTLEIWLESGGE